MIWIDWFFCYWLEFDGYELYWLDFGFDYEPRLYSYNSWYLNCSDFDDFTTLDLRDFDCDEVLLEVDRLVLLEVGTLMFLLNLNDEYNWKTSYKE